MFGLMKSICLTILLWQSVANELRCGGETALKLCRKWALSEKGIPQNHKDNFYRKLWRTLGVISASQDPIAKMILTIFTWIEIVEYNNLADLQAKITDKNVAGIFWTNKGEAGAFVPDYDYWLGVKRLQRKQRIYLLRMSIQTESLERVLLAICEIVNSGETWINRSYEQI
jgi:ornithine--oxo-acid transaminase